MRHNHRIGDILGNMSYCPSPAGVVFHFCIDIVHIKASASKTKSTNESEINKHFVFAYLTPRKKEIIFEAHETKPKDIWEVLIIYY